MLVEQEVEPIARHARGHDAGQRRPRRERDVLVRGLGWLGIGLGLLGLLAPRRVARLIGAGGGPGTSALVRAVAARELATGIAILARKHPSPALSARVAGDALDLALLGSAFARPGADRGRLAAATAVVSGVTALDIAASRGHAAGERRKHVEESITIACTPAQAYAVWRDFEQLPRFMKHLESVRVIDSVRSVWRTDAPVGRSVEWTAEIVEDTPNERIAWHSIEGSVVRTHGVVRFETAPGGRGTEVHVEMDYEVPLGALVTSVAKLFRKAPEQQVADDLRAFKQILEVGEIVRSDSSVHGRPHSARPPRADELGGRS
jgi:uncharacterized membrane protein